jgi:RNA polymerase sigma-70 factor (ECF subfamily)
MLQDEDLAADAVHETFVKALLGIQALQDPLALRSWLYRIARNEALAALRYPERRSGSDPDLLQDPETPQTLAEQNNFREHVQAAVDTLSAEYREVLALREEEDLSYGEIAEVTGSSISAVKARLFKARRALVSRLRPVLSERKEDRDGVRNSSNEPQRMD